MTDKRDELALTIGYHVALLRNRKQWPQWELAYRAGLNPKTISRIEAGKTLPTLRVLVSLADAFGMNPAELLPEWYDGRYGAYWRWR